MNALTVILALIASIVFGVVVDRTMVPRRRTFSTFIVAACCGWGLAVGVITYAVLKVAS